MDVVLEIIKEGKTHNVDSPHRRYRRGDILSVYLPEQVGTITTESPFYYIFVNNIPAQIPFEKIKRVLEQRSSDDPATLERNRLYRIPQSALTNPIKKSLLDTGQATVNWNQARPRIRKKLIVIPNDPSQDDESNAVTEVEIENG